MTAASSSQCHQYDAMLCVVTVVFFFFLHILFSLFFKCFHDKKPICGRNSGIIAAEVLCQVACTGAHPNRCTKERKRREGEMKVLTSCRHQTGERVSGLQINQQEPKVQYLPEKVAAVGELSDMRGRY